MSELTARVTFRKAVSDGNYGTEAAEIAMDVPQDEDEFEETIAAALSAVRRLVHDELARSPSYAVKHALEYPKPIEERARESAELELAIGRRQNDEDLPF